MTGYVRLRAKRLERHGRQQVVHLYEEWDTWHPYRLTLCGREVDADRLTPEGVDAGPACVQCQRHLDSKEVSLT